MTAATSPSTDIPSGFCGCGCGERTSIFKSSHAAKGRVRGQHARYRRGHSGRIDPKVRFWAKVDKTDSCWLWTGALTGGGYGNFLRSNQLGNAPAHRVAYELLVGPIPEGLDLDHLCRVRNCVNPDHLEPVTRRENSLRGESPFTRAYVEGRCTKGHEREPGTVCKVCRQARRRKA